MKKKFLDYAITSIHNYNPNYDDVRLAELRYGLEVIYLTITKTIVISIIAGILGLFKEMIIMVIIFNILRTTGFGLHATKSWICLVSTSLIFIGFPYISNILKIPTILKFILSMISTILIFIYSPADTEKRPLIKKKKRIMFKIITTINCIILNVISLLINNYVLSNLIIFSIWTEIILILPISYRVFNFSYNNYKNYIPIQG